jgi:hypothetical protein
MVRWGAIWLLGLLFFAPSLFASEQACPWLDAATAGGILGGPVKARINSTACEFSRGQLKLRIEVKASATAHEQLASDLNHCDPGKLPLKGIGNEAFLCPRNREILGRVRNALFKVRLVLPDDSWKRKAEEVAEQVAGILF